MTVERGIREGEALEKMRHFCRLDAARALRRFRLQGFRSERGFEAAWLLFSPGQVSSNSVLRIGLLIAIFWFRFIWEMLVSSIGCPAIMHPKGTGCTSSI